MSEVSKLTPKQVEELILQKDKNTATDPLDSHSSFFYLYIHRFKQQVRLLSKKQLIRLVDTLVQSDFNNAKDINDLMILLNRLNLNSIARLLINVVEFPLNENEIKSFSKQEKESFNRFDNLLAEKYVTSLEQIKDPSNVKSIQDVIKHKFNQKEFNKREQVEKDAFATANQLICSKTLLIQHTVLEQIKLDSEKKEGDNNGTTTETKNPEDRNNS